MIDAAFATVACFLLLVCLFDRNYRPHDKWWMLPLWAAISAYLTLGIVRKNLPLASPTTHYLWCLQMIITAAFGGYMVVVLIRRRHPRKWLIFASGVFGLLGILSLVENIVFMY